ncbi:RecF/RecN/SMC N terminal domain-containing protein [Thermoanaerobacter thermohydrosulfuricus]|uniref:Nuclease SbcCD subunit C n=1 Tax=Thermoanaerobacter thermohydrosulfuricus TaxID=1516 RepID=A0A1G7UNW0_THETY|nr:AAA family ATPase [Thermoanaerobacter thermohydrosulfuricus]SDG49193.1 RecF/RecN/SMC N terminal domain-containing protein [Thermoanaerobacter thermohydrosulfuricus]
MVIKSMVLKNFKNHKNLSITFDNKRTIIYGDNGAGKTSIGEAITWCLTGANLFGTENITNKLITIGKGEMAVTLVIEKDGKEYEITRSKKKNEIEITINGVKSTQIDLYTQFIQDKDVFFTIFNPLYFTNLAPRDAKAILYKVLPEVSNEEVFKALPLEIAETLKKNGFNNANTFIEKQREILKDWEEGLLKLEGNIEVYRQIIEAKIPEMKTFNETKLKELETQLLELQKNQNVEIEKELAILKEQYKNPPIEKPQLKDVSVLQKAREDLVQEYKRIQQQIKNLKPQYITCTNCGHKIDVTAKEKQLLLAKLQEIKEKGTKIAAELKAAIEENEKIKKEFEEKVNKYRKVLETKIKKLENELNTNTDKEQVRQIIQQIERLKFEEREVISHNESVKALLRQKEEAKKKLKEVEKDIKLAEQKINEVKTLIEYAKSFAAKKLELEAAEINKYLNKVSLQLWKIVQSTGEIKDDFKILYDGKEFNILSYSERIKAGLEIANLIIGLTNTKFPIFIDNAESITAYSMPDTQILEARVKEGARKLEIKTGGN